MNSNEHKQLDQLLKDQLSEGSVHVPDFVWDRIEEELFPKKKRRGFFWWFFGALCLLIMAVLFGVAFSGEKAHSQHVSISQRVVSKTSDASTLKDKKPTRNKQLATVTNFVKTKRISSVKADKHITKRTKSSNSLFTGNQNSEKKFSKFAGRSAFKTKSGSRVSSNGLNPEKTPAEDSIDSSNQSGLNRTERNPIVESAPENPDEKAGNEVGTKTDSISKKDLSYEEVLALVKKDFPESADELQETKPNSFFSLSMYGGPSIYNSAVFKDYFTSGQLSKRTFTSSGFELGLQARFKIGKRFQVYAGCAFNQKRTQFNYDLAITETDYFTYVANGEKVPFENINDDGTNSCFLAKDVYAQYQIQSVLFSLGTNFEFLRIGKFSAAVDLRLACNVYSSLHLKEVRVLDIQQPNSEKFSYFQPGAGLSLNYQVNQRISLGLAPSFSKQFYMKSSYSRKLDELVIPITVSFNF